MHDSEGLRLLVCRPTILLVTVLDFNMQTNTQIVTVYWAMYSLVAHHFIIQAILWCTSDSIEYLTTDASADITKRAQQ